VGVWLGNIVSTPSQSDLEAERRNVRQDSLARIANTLFDGVDSYGLDWDEDDSIFVTTHDGTNWKCVVCSKIGTITDPTDTMPAVDTLDEVEP
jgi:hypothetical protein